MHISGEKCGELILQLEDCRDTQLQMTVSSTNTWETPSHYVQKCPQPRPASSNYSIQVLVYIVMWCVMCIEYTWKGHGVLNIHHASRHNWNWDSFTRFQSSETAQCWPWPEPGAGEWWMGSRHEKSPARPRQDSWLLLAGNKQSSTWHRVYQVCKLAPSRRLLTKV